MDNFTHSLAGWALGQAGLKRCSGLAVPTLIIAANLPDIDAVAALMGVLIPMSLFKLDRDQAMGASVMITAVTDSGGFFIFLGLATLFLL